MTSWHTCRGGVTVKRREQKLSATLIGCDHVHVLGVICRLEFSIAIPMHLFKNIWELQQLWRS